MTGEKPPNVRHDPAWPCAAIVRGGRHRVPAFLVLAFVWVALDNMTASVTVLNAELCSAAGKERVARLAVRSLQPAGG